MVVVVSALAGVTDALVDRDVDEVERILKTWKRQKSIPTGCFQCVYKMLALCRRCCRAGPRARSLLVSLGEKISAALLSQLIDGKMDPALCARAVPVWADVSLVERDARGGLQVSVLRLEACRKRNLIPVVTGFCASDARTGRTCLMGRDGSDTTATLLACGLGESCAIFTDVAAVMTVDPRVCDAALPIKHMTFGEAQELAFHGASVLHGECLYFAQKNANNTLTVAHVADRSWRRRGTLLTHGRARPKWDAIVALAVLENRVAVSVCSDRGVPGFACGVFQRVCSCGVSVEMFSQTCSETSMCLLVPEASKDLVVGVLQDYDVSVSESLCVLTVVGESMRNTPGVAASVCEVLADCDINIRCISQGASERSLSVAVPQDDLFEAVQAVHSLIVELPEDVEDLEDLP